LTSFVVFESETETCTVAAVDDDLIVGLDFDRLATGTSLSSAVARFFFVGDPAGPGFFTGNKGMDAGMDAILDELRVAGMMFSMSYCVVYRTKRS
jgi:hypothetical protein